MQGSLYEKLKLINKYFIEKKSTKLNGIFPTTSKFNSQQSRNTLIHRRHHREESENRIKAEHNRCTQTPVSTRLR